MPTASPVQRMVPSDVSTNCIVGRSCRAFRRARRSRRPAPSARSACSALASEPASAASGAKVKPSSRPITWPSTVTSPVLPISVFKTLFSRRRRINTLVRRSTKRSVSRSCSASDNLFSTSRVIPCQCSGSPSQSGRLATKVQVRICAIRPDSVSISPLTRSAWSTWAANQSSGIRPFFIRKSIERGHQFGMGRRRQPAVIRDLAGVPQPFHGGRAVGHVAHIAVAGGMVEHAQILGDRRAGQGLMLGRQRQRHLQARRARKNPVSNCAIAAF